MKQINRKPRTKNLLMNSNYIYCDMDGVIADFNAEPNGVERFAQEQGFFERLAPIEQNLSVVRKLVEMGKNVFILTASPNEQADNDKRKWLSKHFPQMKQENVIIMRNGQNKADFVNTPMSESVLIDDYRKNVEQWLSRNGHTIKINNDGKKSNGLTQFKKEDSKCYQVKALKYAMQLA